MSCIKKVMYTCKLAEMQQRDLNFQHEAQQPVDYMYMLHELELADLTNF